MIENVAGALDHLRSGILRRTLKLGPVAPLFYTRSYRLAILFSIACVITLATSMLYPLWVLLIGPLVYGVPHIVASLRYFHYVAGDGSSGSRSRILLLLTSVLFIVFAYRLLVSVNVFGWDVKPLSEWKGSTYLELGALVLTVLGGAWIYGKPIGSLFRSLVLLLPLFIAFRISALWTVGALVLVHNFIAFVYWIIAAKTQGEKRVAWIAFCAMSGMTVGIFLGVFDWVHRFAPPSQILNLANLSIADTGRLIAPWSSSERFWLHASVAFAFGQSMHYFVWLKAIPDQFHYNEVPTSFRQSWSLLGSDFGRIASLAILIILAGTWVAWLFLSLERARFIYFSLAAYHGYLEIAGLALRRRAAPIRIIISS